MAQFNLVGEKFDPPVDRELFLDSDSIEPLLDTDLTMAHLLCRLGKFKSVGEAKRNGWDKPIPTGWFECSIGKGKNRMDLFIWNPTTTLAEFNELNGESE